MFFNTWRLFLLVILSWSNAAAQDSLLVVATTSVFADMADNISGGRLRVESIIPAGRSPHNYIPSVAAGQSLRRADLLLYNGLGLEPWLDSMIRQVNPALLTYRLTKNIRPLEGPDNTPDPHAWLSAEKGLAYLENVQAGLSALNPHDSDIFEFNHGIYRQQLLDLDLKIQSLFVDIPPSRRMLLTEHDPFHYYGERYGLHTGALRKEAGARAEARVIFFESTADTVLLRQLADKRGMPLAGPLYAGTVSDSAGSAPTYLTMLSHNSQLIARQLMEAPAPAKRFPRFWKYWVIPLLLLAFFLLWRSGRLYRRKGKGDQKR